MVSQPPASTLLERARIVVAARRHFFPHGFRGVTMDDLASELGMSKKTLYAHFRSKTALLEAVLRDKFAGAEAALAKAAAAAGDDFSSALHALLEAIRQQVAEIQPAFVRDIRREAPEMFALVESSRRLMVQKYFGPLFESGQKKGRVRKDLAASLLVEILVTATDAIVNPAKLEQLGLSPREAYLAVIDVFLEGALTRKGGSR